MRLLLLHSHQDSEPDGLGRIEMISIGQALEPRSMQLIVVSRHLHLCHAIPVGGCPIGMHDEIDAFERCAALAIDDLNGNFISRSGKCTATAAIMIRLIGIGRTEGANDSGFFTLASRKERLN